MTRLAIASLAAALLLQYGVASAGQRGPSTPEERVKAVEYSKALEADPLASDAGAKRHWLAKWVTEVPDISVKVCVDLLGPALDDKYRYSSEVSLQMAFAAAAFVIQYPDEAGDDQAMYLAGLEGSLRVYRALLDARPDEARLRFLDKLVKAQHDGKLSTWVAKTAKKNCKP